MDQTFSWVPSSESIRKCEPDTRLMQRAARAATYAEIHNWSVRNPEAFWERTIRKLNIKLRKPTPVCSIFPMEWLTLNG